MCACAQVEAYRCEDGALPAGLVLDERTGALSGVPTAAVAAHSTAVVTVSNAGGEYDVQVDVTVLPQPPRVRYPVVAAAAVGEAVHLVVPDIEDGGDDVVFDEDAENVLPAGLVVDPKTGAISGVPTQPFSGTAVVVATNAGGSVRVEVPVEVAEAAPAVAYPPVEGRVGEAIEPVLPTVEGRVSARRAWRGAWRVVRVAWCVGCSGGPCCAVPSVRLCVCVCVCCVWRWPPWLASGRGLE